jgi:hypothetical protein
MIPGGGWRNHEFFGPKVQVSERIPLELAELAFDPRAIAPMSVNEITTSVICDRA